MRRWLLLIALLLPIHAFGNGSASGFCEVGNQKVTVSGLSSTTLVQRSFPSCVVSVFNSGTVTPATIYSDNANPPTAIPGGSFTANTNGSWQFYAANGSYDVVLSGAGFPTPLTKTAVTVGAGSGLGVNCAIMPGANFGVKFANAVADLPSTGGIVDCSNLQGAQTIASDVFSGVTKPIRLLWPSGTVTSAISFTQPATMLFDFGEAGVLSVASATTATINGTIEGGSAAHFAGPGGINFGPNQPFFLPGWFTGWTGTTNCGVFGSVPEARDGIYACPNSTSATSRGDPVTAYAFGEKFVPTLTMGTVGAYGQGIDIEPIFTSAVANTGNMTAMLVSWALAGIIAPTNATGIYVGQPSIIGVGANPTNVFMIQADAPQGGSTINRAIQTIGGDIVFGLTPIGSNPIAAMFTDANAGASAQIIPTSPLGGPHNTQVSVDTTDPNGIPILTMSSRRSNSVSGAALGYFDWELQTNSVGHKAVATIYGLSAGGNAGKLGGEIHFELKSDNVIGQNDIVTITTAGLTDLIGNINATASGACLGAGKTCATPLDVTTAANAATATIANTNGAITGIVELLTTTRAANTAFNFTSYKANGVQQWGVDGTGNAAAAGFIQPGSFTYAGRPTTTAGSLIWVTDSNTQVWGATVAGGGAGTPALAVYDGVNWTVVGK